ncbi:hypothetical protein [uncultured Selenomonas sp.]|jgi:hypothetical protein|uniref:virion core protein, T7 gp14 family n=1 Tax=uncultured Selenomonas sp. TaxID=159275 RepID=UPI002804B90F|nr:hypothetical protein [uncultured Selenomonas sp.]
MGAVVAVGSALVDVYAQNKSLEAQARANVQTAKNIITSMNYGFQNLEQERADAFDATVADLQKIRLQGGRLTSQVGAAVNEGLAGGGRTANLLKRSAQADTNRALSSTRDNYRRKSNEIDLNKESQAMEAKGRLNSIAQVEKPSLWSTLLKLGTAYYRAEQTEDAIQGIRAQGGVKDSAMSTGSSHSSSGVSNKLYWDTSSSSFKTIYDDAPDYSSLFHTNIDWKNTSFKFEYINPYTEKNQTINFF